MKKLLLFCFLLPILGYSQSYEKLKIPWQDGEIVISNVVNVENASKDQIFNASKIWFSETFNSSKSVLDIDDRKMGMLSGKAWSKIESLHESSFKEFRMWYKIIIEIKDERYRYQIKNIEFELIKSPFTKYPAESVLSEKGIFGTNNTLNVDNFGLFAKYTKVVERLDSLLKTDIQKKINSQDW